MSFIALAMLLSAGEPSRAASPNLDFATGTLAGWEQQGNTFQVTTASGRGPSLSCGVCSSDRGTLGRTGLLRFQFVVPQGAGQIHFSAYACRAKAPKDWQGNENLDVILAAPGKRVIPKEVLTTRGWEPAPLLLPRWNNQPRQYRWDVSGYVGRTLQIVLGDQDDRPGCHLFCSGFHIVPGESSETQAFTDYMVRLATRNRLAPPVCYHSRHFTALSNAADKFTRLRLNNCELIYHQFFEHFRRKGFTLEQPPGRLMVAIFDSQSGLEAYVGQKISPYITGMYHPATNRLVVYDYGRNEAFVAIKRQALQKSNAFSWHNDKQRYIDTVQRQAQEFRTGANIGTTMHEVAHQLSYNCGMLNRLGNVPCWLAEGLACYCEATSNGAWQGIGEPNPERMNTLAGRGQLFRLEDLVSSDDWLRKSKSANAILTGYAQSWALFHMLMKDRPRAMRNYLALIYHRRTPKHRLTDFRQAFGDELNRLELDYFEYLKKLVEEHREVQR
jgi:hypothetical protein